LFVEKISGNAVPLPITPK